MRIHTPEVVEDKTNVTIRVLVEYHERKEHLWYSVSREYGDWLTPERQDAFVVALLLLAMKDEEDVYVDGVMSEKLFYNLVNHYMKIITSVIPSLHRVNIIPKELDCTILNPTRGGVATGFSGGVDSFCVLADHLYGSVPDGFRVTHLLFNNVGSHGEGGRRLFNERYDKLLPVTQELGLPFLKIDSNLRELLDPNFHFQLTHTLRNVSAVLILQRFISRYYYASTYRYEDCFVGKTYDLAYTDPMAVHLLSTETTECISSGCQYSRVEKTMRIAEVKPSHQYLDICTSSAGAGNCSTCWKCARTLLTLEVLGTLDMYNRVFDLDKYRRIRNRYIGQVLSSKDPLLKEIVQLARERNYSFPLLSHLLSLYRRLIPSFVRRKIRG